MVNPTILEMAEQIIDRFHQFALTEEEKETMSIKISDVLSSIKDCDVSLLGNVISYKRVNLQGVKNAMPVAWGNQTGLQIKEIGWNFFQFKFKDKETMDKVLFGTPWLYDNFLLNVHPWESGLKSTSSTFNVCDLWVQVWNIPLHWMSTDVGHKIENTLGGIVDIVIPANGSKEGQYIRLKVRINITKPLPKVKLIKLESETTWVEIRYENLPYVCYYCGLLGHNDKTCTQRAKDV
ncbi:uncharacterized protein At4g02000-like [Solanum dulcamara]|uniref:uncharacterized protein At4g02000-like n=1 Tax=Solanum dulcamara TaxID=45834 RepID=UPI002486B7DA|nr:uncharacterized protein At4g02000-like [Solanum dulcamara]